MSPPGRRYLYLNAGISLAAFYVLYHFRDDVLIGDTLAMSIVAGFGGMVVMRSKIFNFKTEKGETYAVGPDAVLSAFLTSVDRQIDRYRASRRQDLVYEETQSVVDPQSAPEFLKTFLVSYQNLSNEERVFINSEIKRIYEGTDFKWPRLKFMVIAFGFLNIMGEKNFKALVDQLKKYQKLPAESVASSAGAPAPQLPPPPNTTPASPPSVPPVSGETKTTATSAKTLPETLGAAPAQPPAKPTVAGESTRDSMSTSGSSSVEEPKENEVEIPHK